MYAVNLHVLLHARDRITVLFRRIELPSPPSPGLELEGITARAEPTETIRRVVWSIPQRCYYAELEDWRSDDETVAEMIDFFGPGWEEHEPNLSLLCGD